MCQCVLFRINGKELSRIDSKQIELLIECALMSNLGIKERDFSSMKNKNIADAKIYEIEQESYGMLHEIDKMRINSYIISKYYEVKYIHHHDWYY